MQDSSWRADYCVFEEPAFSASELYVPFAILRRRHFSRIELLQLAHIERYYFALFASSNGPLFNLLGVSLDFSLCDSANNAVMDVIFCQRRVD